LNQRKDITNMSMNTISANPRPVFKTIAS